MNPLLALARWLDIRPSEYRAFLVTALGAFLTISFTVVARALREAFFLDEFSVRAIPYIAIATAILSLPTVGAFTRLLTRRSPFQVFNYLIAVLMVGLGVLWFVMTPVPGETITTIGTVAFYLFTAIGTLLLTSGFWVVTSEEFALREAKRLFGMISGGGTLGAMLAGLSLGPVGSRIGNSGLVIGLIVTLGLLLLLQMLLPRRPGAHGATEGAEDTTIRESLTLVAQTRHLRLMATIVALATMASFMVDYQFKEAASLAYTDDAALAGFLGRFYGITGVVALLLQLLVASRLLSSVGVSWTLSILPMMLLGGSAALVAVPSLASLTMVRGADNSLRKSLHRAVLEYLYVPVPSTLRRKTKTFIDSFVDSAAEGVAAAVVWLWVTVAVLPSRWMSLLVAALAVALLWVARAMGAQYFRTLLDRLDEGQETLEDSLVQTQFAGGEMTMTVTLFDLKAALEQTGAVPTLPVSLGGPDDAQETTAEATIDRITSMDPTVVARALDEAEDWDERHVPALTRLLARDAFYRRAGSILSGQGEAAVGTLAAHLDDEQADFVIRRRIPRVLAPIDTQSAEDALLAGLAAGRFEVRYRCGVALARRRKKALGRRSPRSDTIIWESIRREVSRERPIWELQKLLDDRPEADDFVSDKVYGRGELSLEHAFRLLSLVLDPEPIRTSFHGVVLDDERLRSISLEYLEQVLPPDVRERLWPFIGDLSEHHQAREIRDMDAVVGDLLKSGATLFGGKAARERLRAALDEDYEGED